MKFNVDQPRVLLSGQVPKHRLREVGEKLRVFTDGKFKVDQWSDRVGQILQPNREDGGSRSRSSRIKDRIVIEFHPFYSLNGLIGMLSTVVS